MLFFFVLNLFHYSLYGLSLDGSLGNGKDNGILQFGTPDDVDVSIELKDWLFALEGAQEAAERWWFCNNEDSSREERCWHTTFHSIGIKAKGSPKQITNGNTRLHGKLKHPIELVTVRNHFSFLHIY